MKRTKREKRIKAAGRSVTPAVSRLFYAEISNEADGGVSPSTLFSTADSVMQAPDIMCREFNHDDFAALLWIMALVGPKTQVDDILDAAERS